MAFSLFDVPVPPWLIAALALLCVSMGVWLGLTFRRWWFRRVLARRFGHARRGEADARGWLARNGFTVIEEQAARTTFLLVDGEELPFTVRADYLVERLGRQAIVEVKTGAAADPATRDTRRQILEYAWVFGVSDIYLFDADAEQLRQIEVPAALPSA